MILIFSFVDNIKKTNVIVNYVEVSVEVEFLSIGIHTSRLVMWFEEAYYIIECI